jgi:hypothetical protein
VLDIDKREGANFLTARAIEALVALLKVLVISLVALTPTIASGVLAAFVLLVAVESAISPGRLIHAANGQTELSKATLFRLITAIGLTLTLLIAGITLAAGTGGGLLWLPAAFVLAIFVAAVNAWVLLVEVLRRSGTGKRRRRRLVPDLPPDHRPKKEVPPRCAPKVGCLRD